MACGPIETGPHNKSAAAIFPESEQANIMAVHRGIVTSTRGETPRDIYCVLREDGGLGSHLVMGQHVHLGRLEAAALVLFRQEGPQPAFQRNLRRSLTTRFEPSLKILDQDPVLHLGLCHD